MYTKGGKTGDKSFGAALMLQEQKPGSAPESLFYSTPGRKLVSN